MQTRMEPKSFEIVLKYDATNHKMTVVLDPNTGEVAMGLNTVKDILGFLQRVIIKRFC